MKIKFFTLFLALTAMVAASTTVHAAPIETFNSPLTQGPGVYFASTTTNSGFDVVSATMSDGSKLQLGLEANTRFVGPITPNTNDYSYTPGSPTNNGLASWDFTFSVNTGSDPLSSYFLSITIADLTTGKSVVFNPTLLPDNGQASGSAVVCHGCAYNGSNDGMQNAENLGFSFLGTPLNFNANAPDYYAITLSALPTNGLSADPSVTIDLTPTTSPTVTPEPSSLVLLGTGILGLAGGIRRKSLFSKRS